MIKLVRKTLLVLSTALLTMQTLGMPIGIAKENELSSIPSNPIDLTSTGSSEIIDEKSEESEEENSTPEQQKENTRDPSEGEILESDSQHDTIGLSEDSHSSIIQTWTLRDFPLTISHIDEVLRPELIPDEVKYITTLNSQMPGSAFWLLNGVPVSSGVMLRNNKYTVSHIASSGSDRLIDMSFTPELPTGLNINGRGTAQNTIYNGRITGQIQATYTDDQTIVEGYMLLGLAAHSPGTQSISKEDLKGVVVASDSPDVRIFEYEDSYTINLNGNHSIGFIVPTTYTLDRRIPAINSIWHNFWPRLLLSATSPWNPDFKPLEMTGLVEEEKFVSKYEITQDVPLLSGEDYKLTLSTEAPIAPNPSLVVYDENEEKFDIGSLQTNDQGQAEVTITASEIAQFRGKTMKIGIEYALIASTQSNLAEYLDDEGYVSIPLSARSNKGTDQVSATAQTWVRPWGEGIHQEIGLNTSTSELNPADFVGNLENKLLGDEPFAVDFAEEREFDTLGGTSIGVVIESAISGIQNTVTVPVTVIENTMSSVFVHHVDSEGDTLAESEEISGKIGESYETYAKEIENYRLTEQPVNATGIFEDEPIEVIYVYETAPVMPVDPLDPGTEVNPENPPVLPEDQGLFSLDFASSFDFGKQVISAKDQTHYAKPQRLLDEEGNILEGEDRPNYVQISDRRPTQERDGWELSVRQNEQFTGSAGELTGARLVLQNQQIDTAQGGTSPGLQHTTPMILNPGGAKRTLLKAQGPEGEGTWIYRFGDADTAAQSVALEVPKGATPSATSYKTTLTWELSSVPDN